MWSLCIVVDAPLLDNNLGFLEAVKDLAIQQFVPELAVEGLAVAILPWAAGCDVERLHTDLRQLFLHGVGDKFWAIVRSNILRDTMDHHGIGQLFNDLDRSNPSGAVDR